MGIRFTLGKGIKTSYGNGDITGAKELWQADHHLWLMHFGAFKVGAWVYLCCATVSYIYSCVRDLAYLQKFIF